MFPNSLNITQQIIDDLDLIYIWLILLMALFLLCLYFSFHALFFRSRLRSLRSALFRLLLLGLHHCLLLLRLLFYILFLFLTLHSLSLSTFLMINRSGFGFGFGLVRFRSALWVRVAPNSSVKHFGLKPAQPCPEIVAVGVRVGAQGSSSTAV